MFDIHQATKVEVQTTSGIWIILAKSEKNLESE